jgi:hypothetical protein
MKKKILLSVGILISLLLQAQKTYEIDVRQADKKIVRGHLDLGGKNIKGDTIGVNSFYLERNGKPFIPVIGEFHFSRYPNQYWDEEIKKMKAGGINVVATYVFWIMHEFKEGKFDWTGDLNVRRFTEICAENGMDVLMRIGPFAHGEIRNGGLPDWLYGRPIDVRSNDPEYLFYVNRFYKEIGKQLHGLMFRDGGPIIGIQIENEYQHSAAPWGFTYVDAPKERTAARRDNKIIQDGVGINNQGNEFAGLGNDHMKNLKQLAVNAGLVAPIYTATGWGYATIIEKASVPVMAGYAYPFWSAGNSPSPFYLFKDIHQKPDYSPVSYDVNLYPSMAAELGTGMSVTYSRRPRVPGESFLPLMVRTVGSGTNGLGYYMYHGGTTPSVGNYFLSEGAGLNNKSYDYQAPIGEFGNVSSGYYSLKLINYFLKSFGNELAPLPTVLPSSNDSIEADNIKTLRYAIRTDGDKGFLFMHNFQDHLVTSGLQGLKISVLTKSGTINFPATGTFTLNAGSSAILPFNLDIEGLTIRMATLQPFCHFRHNENQYNVFVSIDGIAPEMILKGKVKVKGNDLKIYFRGGNTCISLPHGKICEMQLNGKNFLVLPFNVAQDAYPVGTNDQHLIISKALVLENNQHISLICKEKENAEMSVYPSVQNIETADAVVTRLKPLIKNFSQWQIQIPKTESGIQLIKTDDRHFVLKAKGVDWTKMNDVFVTFDYRGDRGICMMNGEQLTDNFYTSKPWIVGLKRYATALKNSEMYFYFMPMSKDAPYLSYLDKTVIPDFGSRKEFLEIKTPLIETEQRINIELK